MRTLVTVGTVLGVLSGLAAPVAAQGGGVVLEGGTARSLPPSGVGLDAATYAMGGVRLEWGSPRGSFRGGVYGGQATDDAGSDFLSGTLAGEFWLSELGPVAFGVGGMVRGFAVKEPFYYRVAAAEVSPDVRFGSGRAYLVIRGRIGAGSSRLELRRDDGAVRRADHDLWSRGVETELSVGSSAVSVTAFTSVHRSSGGDFRGRGLRALAVAGPVAVRGVAELWDTPLGTEFSGGLSMSIAVGPWQARASADRTGPDPLTLVEPGKQTGLMVGVRVVSFGGKRVGAVHEVVREGRPARVRVHVTLPSAGSVELLGDFSDWRSVPLQRDGLIWSAEIEVDPGTYHFGFLVDGEWWLPEDLQGTVPDEWGRRNATMIVPE